MSQEYQATTLLLVRHGQARATDSSSLGRETPLSRLGRLQAAALADALAGGEPPVAVYTSPLLRSVETAAPLCERLGVKAMVDRRLTEFELGTKSLDSIQARPDLLIWQPEHKAADGETLSEFSARVAAFCDGVVERHLGESVVVVCHSGTIDATLRWSLDMAAASSWQHEFDIANASITEIEFWPHGRIEGGAPRYAVLRRAGDVEHLGGLITEI